MVRVVGIDPGTGSFDICCLEDGKLCGEFSTLTEEVAKNPEVITKALNRLRPLDLVVGPSGYGLPLTPISKVGERELELLTLIRPEERKAGFKLGVRSLVRRLGEEGLKVYFIPSVKHLSTVPVHRKINRLDMGTPDKVCSVALGIYDQARRFSLSFNSTSFILAEMGLGFNAYIGVEGGAIVDGIGGTLGGTGFLSSGGMDTQLAYLLGGFSRDLLFQGGAAYVADLQSRTPEELAERREADEPCQMAWENLMENIERGILSLKVSVRKPREILLSGRLTRVKELYAEAVKRLSRHGDVRRIEGFASEVKEAAQGAALLADGLAGGIHRDLVDCLQLNEAEGSIFDHIYLSGVGELRRTFHV